jgi:imidazoleglycerol-phosphate dehydratase
MGAIEGAEQGRRTRARLSLGKPGGTVETGISALDHLLGLAAASGGFGLSLEVAPGAAVQEVADAGRAVGDELAEPLRAAGVRGLGSAFVPAGEALAQVSLEASGRPLLVSNVDLAEARVGGLETDAVASFLQALAEAAGLTVHVRLLEGRETQHVLDAIFKALGAALGEALRPKP